MKYKEKEKEKTGVLICCMLVWICWIYVFGLTNGKEAKPSLGSGCILQCVSLCVGCSRSGIEVILAMSTNQYRGQCNCKGIKGQALKWSSASNQQSQHPHDSTWIPVQHFFLLVSFSASVMRVSLTRASYLLSLSPKAPFLWLCHVLTSGVVFWFMVCSDI